MIIVSEVKVGKPQGFILKLQRGFQAWLSSTQIKMSLCLVRVEQMAINGKTIKRAGNSTYSKTIMTKPVLYSVYEHLVVMQIDCHSNIQFTYIVIMKMYTPNLKGLRLYSFTCIGVLHDFNIR